MKLYKFILPIMACAFVLGSCDDDKMEWGTPDGQGDVSLSEIPLALAEKIANYDFIKSYVQKYTPHMTVGVGLGADLYINDATYKQVADDNFQMLTTGNAMKHSSVVNGKGELNFTTIDAFFNVVPHDIPIYGHNFIWHTQQRASYLNSLIAPDVIIEPDAGGNILPTSDLKNGDFGDWNPQNKGAGITIEDNEGMNGGKAIKMIAGSGSDAWNLQLITPEIPALTDHEYELTFWVRSEDQGKGRISFQNLTNGYPWMDWLGTGSYSEAFEFATTWIQVQVKLPALAEGNSFFKCQFDFGYIPNATYYLDINTLSIVDLSAPTEVNYCENGSFENGDTGWIINNSSGGVEITEYSDAIDGTHVLKMVANESAANAWDLQVASADMPTLPDDKVRISFYVKADQEGKGRLSFNGGVSNKWPWMNWTGSQSSWTEAFDVGTSWQEINVVLQNFSVNFVDGETTWSMNLDFGYLPNVTYYLDNFKVTTVEEEEAAAATRTPKTAIIYVEKTEEEKKELITNAMEEWIKGMLDHCKDRVKIWDVINEPISDDCRWRGVDFVPSAEDIGDQEFYWGQYIGKEYAYKAFEFARKYGNPNDLLFVNDYNLETNPNKLAALIEFVKYIEQNGQVVDGIGTQMHVSTSITKDQVDAMFKTMAQTGKLIRVTELDVQVGTLTPSTDQLAAQADTYQMIFESYLENIPQAQQSGITIWSLTDHKREHEYWLSEDTPNLFDSSYGRKHAYKGVCDGIAGYDVSIDFDGSLWNVDK